MKEVVRRLAEEAGFVFWAGEEWAPGSEIDWSSDYDREFNKFVELIVRECADIATINQFQHDEVGNYVLKHFEL